MFHMIFHFCVTTSIFSVFISYCRTSNTSLLKHFSHHRKFVSTLQLGEKIEPQKQLLFLWYGIIVLYSYLLSGNTLLCQQSTIHLGAVSQSLGNKIHQFLLLGFLFQLPSLWQLTSLFEKSPLVTSRQTKTQPSLTNN